MTYDLMLNMSKSGIKPRIKVSQYDDAIPSLNISLYDQNQSYTIPSGATVYISGTKKDNTGFKYECTVSDNIITAPITSQMTVFSGVVECEITIETAGGQKSSENFILEVEKSALADDVIISETDIPAIQRLSRPASTTQLGVVKVDGSSVTIDADGTLHSSASVDIEQTTGQSTTAVMSQKAVTDCLSNKADLVGGRVPYSQLPETAQELKGVWDASTNTPTLANGVGTNGDTYIVSEGGTWSGETFYVNDEIMYVGATDTWVRIAGSDVKSVNGKVGVVTLDADDIDDTSTANKFVTASEKSTWNGKADTSDIPTNLADLNEDSTHRLVTDTEKTTWNGKSEVSYSQIVLTGTKIAEITINGTTTNIFAPTGGGGGGDMSSAIYDPQGAVANAGGIPNYVSTQITNAITNAIGGSY